MVVSRPLAVRGVDEPRVSSGDRKNEKPIIVIDNYDSFTYNLCQVRVAVEWILVICWG